MEQKNDPSGVNSTPDNDKTIPIDVVDAPTSDDITLTHTDIYATQSKLPLAVRNPFFAFGIALVVITLAVFLLLLLPKSEEPPVVTEPPVGTEPVVTEPRETVPGVETEVTPVGPKTLIRVGGLLSATDIPSSALHSEYALLVELDSMNAVAAKNANRKMYPASLTKVMSFIVAYENLSDRSEWLKITKEIKSAYAAEGASRAGVDTGDYMTVEQCMYAMLLASDTDAVLLLANRTAGSEAAFTAMMNNKAREMGLDSTHFANPLGMHDEDNYTTAVEYAAIFAYALRYDLFRTIITSTEYVTYLGYDNDRKGGAFDTYRFTFYNSTIKNRFEANNLSLEVPGGKILGGKTGFTDEAQNCQALLANVGGKDYIVITAKAKDAASSAKDNIYILKNYIK